MPNTQITLKNNGGEEFGGPQKIEQTHPCVSLASSRRWERAQVAAGPALAGGHAPKPSGPRKNLSIHIAVATSGLLPFFLLGKGVSFKLKQPKKGVPCFPTATGHLIYIYYAYVYIYIYIYHRYIYIYIYISYIYTHICIWVWVKIEPPRNRTAGFTPWFRLGYQGSIGSMWCLILTYGHVYKYKCIYIYILIVDISMQKCTYIYTYL